MPVAADIVEGERAAAPMPPAAAEIERTVVDVARPHDVLVQRIEGVGIVLG